MLLELLTPRTASTEKVLAGSAACNLSGLQQDRGINELHSFLFSFNCKMRRHPKKKLKEQQREMSIIIFRL